MKTLVNIHTGEVSGQQASEKEQVLFAKLGEHESMLIALSGGTDSAYLAWAAHRVLGKRALSVTALSPSYSTYDREQLEKFLEATAIRHEFVETHEMETANEEICTPGGSTHVRVIACTGPGSAAIGRTQVTRRSEGS
jgi:uncharacterized protein